MPAAQFECSSGQNLGSVRLRLVLALPLAIVLLICSPVAGSASALPRLATAAARTTIPAPLRADTGETASVRGTVYDSVTSKPLAGADVQLVDTLDQNRVYTAHADSMGRFRITAMYPGNYIAGFFHPSVDALGIETPLSAAVVHAGSDNVVDLGIPGPSRIMAAVCGPPGRADSSGAMAGVVRNADTGLPMRDAKVIASWHEVVIDKKGLASVQRREPAETGADGTYHICGLPGDDTVLVSVEGGGVHSGIVQIGVSASQIMRRDFTLGDSSSEIAVVADSNADKEIQRATTILHGPARLSGVVRGVGRTPIQGARIMVWGTGLEATSQADGRFNLAGLPAGTFSIEARAIGFEPLRATVDLSGRNPATIEVDFKQRVQQLSRVVVMGKTPHVPADILGFQERSRTGIGHYINESDRDLQQAIDVTEVLRKLPGIQIVPSGSFGHVILMRGRCAPAVYLDGVEVVGAYQNLDDIVLPSQIVGIESYAGLGEAPPRFETHRCGALVVWTKRGT